MLFKYLILTTLFNHCIMKNTDYCHKDGPFSLPPYLITCNQQDRQFKQWQAMKCYVCFEANLLVQYRKWFGSCHLSISGQVKPHKPSDSSGAQAETLLALITIQ